MNIPQPSQNQGHEYYQCTKHDFATVLYESQGSQILNFTEEGHSTAFNGMCLLLLMILLLLKFILSMLHL